MCIDVSRPYSQKTCLTHEFVNLEYKNNKILTESELEFHIRGCVGNDRLSQNKIYISFFGYALSICERYSNNHNDSLEILNDGFLKIFKEIHRYKPAYADSLGSFKGWIRKIMIYTAIDNFRKNKKQRLVRNVEPDLEHFAISYDDALDGLSYNELKNAIQLLTPSYRLTFMLYVIEEYTHEEISKRLGITVGASKSNLARGRKQLQKILFQKYEIKLDPKLNDFYF